MLQFTSALYLGLRHASRSLRPWSQLTTGVPAALAAPRSVVAATRELAALQGCESATLGTSTLHLFWDLGKIFAAQRSAIFIDAGAYPVAMWGMERATARGTPVRRFAHHNVDALWSSLGREPSPELEARGGVRRLLPRLWKAGAAGSLSGDGSTSPRLADDRRYAGPRESLGTRRAGAGRMVKGGGGMPCWSNISGPHLVVVASLAKAFGVPLAALSGSAAFVSHFEEQSETRAHCSPALAGGDPRDAARAGVESYLRRSFCGYLS